MHLNYAPILLSGLLIALNLSVNWFFIETFRAAARTREHPLDHYTFVGDDYPTRIPKSSYGSSGVRLVVEDSVRYTIDQPESTLEWQWTGPAGRGDLVFGGNQRFFSMSMAHQLHCLRAIHRAFAEDEIISGHVREHLTHCLNYLRQAALCAADSTLEPPNVLSRNFSDVGVGRVGGEHRCADYPRLYRFMEENMPEYERHETSSGSR